MRRAPVAFAIVVALAVASQATSASAQPADPAAPPTEPAAAAPVDAGSDPDALARAYQAGFAALAAGDYATAIARLDEVALRSVQPDLRAAARELGRLARDLRERRVRLVIGEAGPGASGAAQRALPEDDRPGAGRVEVVFGSTVFGFYAGFVLIDLLDVGDFRAGTTLVTAATAAGFLGSFYGTRGRDVSGGMAAAYGTGLGLGLGNGLLLASPLGVDTSEGWLSLGLAGATLGGAGALYLADRVRPTIAQVNLASTTGTLGIATVGLGLAIVNPANIEVDTVMLLLAGGLDVGTAAGAGVGRKLDWSKSRSRLVTLSAFLGAVGGFGGSAIALGVPDGVDQGRVMAAAVLGGIWGGFALGIRLTRDMEPDGRFDPAGAPAARVVPTVIGERPGLAIAGAF